MKFLDSVAVGIPVIFLGLILFTGGLENACFVFLLSIICTFGIGLVGWILLCWFIGWVILTFLSCVKKPGGVEKPSVERRPLDREEIAVTTYMKRAEACGMSPAEVARRLRRQGFSDEIIYEARRILN